MDEPEQNDKKPEEQSADEIAEAMVENMKKNMEDPDFFQKQDRNRHKAALEALWEDGLLEMQDLSEEDQKLIDKWEEEKKQGKRK